MSPASVIPLLLPLAAVLATACQPVGVDSAHDSGDRKACRDLNCDGWPDLVFANYGQPGDLTQTSYVYWGQEGGYEASERLELPTLGASDVAAADLDGDGYQDLVFANYATEETEAPSYIYWGTDGGLETEPEPIPSDCAAAVSLAHADGDDLLDILLSNNGGEFDYNTDSTLYLGGADGFSLDNSVGLLTSGAWGNDVADLNADGYPDLLFANSCEPELHNAAICIYWGAASGFSSSHYQQLSSYSPRDVEAADLNGDGWLDVVASVFRFNDEHETESLVWWGSEEGFSGEADQALLTQGAVASSVADLDRDGWPDILFSNHTHGEERALESWIYWGGEGGFEEERRAGLPTTGAWGSAVGDLDGDGWPEVVVSNSGTKTEPQQESWIYWGGEDGFSQERRDGLPTVGAAGVAIVGAF